jgi:hypothetical protein
LTAKPKKFLIPVLHNLADILTRPQLKPRIPQHRPASSARRPELTRSSPNPRKYPPPFHQRRSVQTSVQKRHPQDRKPFYGPPTPYETGMRPRENPLFGFWRRLPAFLNADFDVRITFPPPRPKQRSLRQTPRAPVKKRVWKRESRTHRLLFYGFEEESPHVFGERWFRRSVPVGKRLQKRAKILPEVGKNPQKEGD